mmetsp:Transcript_9580/g.16003  ORF Transcript_9580/g.16003 Transcript_9580/m.16003 type:complete len:294 (+) Transcript_9580:2408-3289(+)
MATPDQAQDLVKGFGSCRYASQAQLHHHADGLRDVRGRLGAQQAAQTRLGSIQEFHKVDPLGVALLHTLKSLPLLLPRRVPRRGRLAGVLGAGLAVGLEVFVDFTGDADVGLRLPLAALLSLLRRLRGALLAIGGVGALKLRQLFGLQLLHALLDLIQQLGGLGTFVPGAFQRRTIGMELHQLAHQLHGRLPGHAGRVLHASDRQVQDPGPELPRQPVVGGQIVQSLQHSIADPNALVQEAGEQRLQQVVLCCRCKRENATAALRDFCLRIRDAIALLLLRVVGATGKFATFS